MQDTIQSTRDGETIIWELPVRDLDSLKPFGWTGVGVGAFGILFMACWMGMPLWWGIQMIIAGQWFGLAFVLFAALGLAGMRHAMFALRCGLAVLRNQTRCTVELSATQLKVCEHLGGAKWRRKIEVNDIHLLVLGDLDEVDSSYRSGGMLAASDLECLSAKLKKSKGTGKKLFPIVIGYPTEMLHHFGEVLVNETKDRQAAFQMENDRDLDHAGGPIRRAPESGTREPKTGEVRLVHGEELAEVAHEQPLDSDIVVREEDGTLAFHVPPAGIWKGSHGLCFFSLIWLLFMTAFSPAFLFADRNGNAGPAAGIDWESVFAFGFVLLFWVVGISMLVAAINLGKRSLMIGVMDDMLFIERKSIFGKRWIQYPIDQLDAIEVGESGIEINDVAVNELQLFPRDEKKVGLLSQRDDDELHWLARRLRLATNINHRQTESWKRLLDEPEQLDSMNVPHVTVTPLADGCEIRIDRIGYRKLISPAITCSVLIAIGIGFAVLMFQNGRNAFDNLFPIMFGVVFLSVAFGILFALYVSCSRHFLILVREDRLAIERFGPLSRRSFQWNLDQIKSITRCDSGTKVNGRRLDELQILAKGTPGLKMMLGREASEIDFVTAQIHRTMPGLDRETVEDDDVG